jgi:uncharacterized protein
MKTDGLHSKWLQRHLILIAKPALSLKCLPIIFGLLIGTSAINAQLCWKISGNDLSKPSYLFGTHHIIDSTRFEHFDQLLDLCLSCEAVVGELKLDDATLQNQILSGATLLNTTLKDVMSASNYQLIDDEFKQSMNIGLDYLDGYKPMFLLTLYSSSNYLRLTGLQKQPDAIDLIFQQKAIKKGLTVYNLETPEFQIDLLFNSIPIDRQVELLVESVKEKKREEGQMKLLNEAYLKGDLNEIARIGELEGWTEDEKALMVYQRNKAWMLQLPDLMRNKTCFIAVGCLHLVGESGLINLLRQQGYHVEPVIAI